MDLSSIGVEADGPRRHTPYCRTHFHLPTLSREPLAHPGNAAGRMGGERHVHIRRLGDPAAAGADPGQHCLCAQFLSEDHGVRDPDLPFQVGIAVAHRRPPRARAKVRCEAPPPFGQGRLVVGIPGPVRSPQSVPYLHHVEAKEGEHEVARGVGRMRVCGHAQAPCSADLVQALVHQPVPDLVVPVDDLAGIEAKREPVPGLRGHLLAEKDQEVIGGQMPPHPRGRDRVVLRGRDEVEPGRSRPDDQLFGESSPSEWSEWTWQSPRYQAAPRPTARADGKLKLDKVLLPESCRANAPTGATRSIAC